MSNKILDDMRDVMLKRHYSIRTEHAYLNWIKQYILFHKKYHPKDMWSFRDTKLIFSCPCSLKIFILFIACIFLPYS